MPLDAAARVVVATLAESALAYAPAAAAGDPDAVHDMRVAIRRVRVALATFRNAFAREPLRGLRRETRRLGRALGKVRDADVHLAASYAALGDAAGDERTGYAYAIERLGARRGDALAAFALALERFDRDAIGRAIAREDVASKLARTLRTRARAFFEDAPRALRRGRDDEVHALRIDVKRIRYTLEFVAPFAGRETAVALEALARLQDRLGALADADTFARTYERLASELAPDDARAIGLRALRERCSADRGRALEAVRALWADDGYPERLAASIAAAVASASP
ncbi:MAG: hypothetical protein NVSMB21_14170 [Vulcanimicrobiaceae bacterium]